MASRVVRNFANSLAVGLALSVSTITWANEVFPAVHDAPITVLIRSGLDGKAVPKAHLFVIAGYDEHDLLLQTWHEEALTDAEGKARLSNRVSNLPFLQVWVTGAALCQGKPRSEAFSVDRVRRDGLSTPNRCGFSTSVDEPGTFTVFVKPSKKLLSPKIPVPVMPASGVEPAAPIPASNVASASGAAKAQPAPSVAAQSAPATPVVVPNASEAAKPASQPAQGVPPPPPAPAASAQPAASTTPIPAEVPVVPPAPASVIPASALPQVESGAPATPLAASPVQAIPKPAAASEPKGGLATGSSAIASKPAAAGAPVRRNAAARRVAPGPLATAAGKAPSSKPANAPAEIPKQPALAPAVAKPAAPAPPAPKIPVSLEAAPPPPPSTSGDAKPHPKPAASRRHAAAFRTVAAGTKHKAAASPNEADKAKPLPAPETTAEKR